MNKLGRFVLELAAAAVLFAVAYLLAQAKGWNPNLAPAVADNAASPEDITPTRPLTEVPEKSEDPAAENPAADAVPAEKPEIPDENKKKADSALHFRDRCDIIGEGKRKNLTGGNCGDESSDDDHGTGDRRRGNAYFRGGKGARTEASR